MFTGLGRQNLAETNHGVNGLGEKQVILQITQCVHWYFTSFLKPQLKNEMLYYKANKITNSLVQRGLRPAMTSA